MTDIDELRARHTINHMTGIACHERVPIANPEQLSVGTLRAILDELATLRKAVVPVVDDEDRKLAQAVRDANARLHQGDDFDMELELAAQHIEAGRITTCGNFGYQIENDRLQAELAALRSAQQWRAIESAPRDGTRVLIRGHRGNEIDIADWGGHGRYDRKSKSYIQCFGAGVSPFFGATEWQPLPATGADK